jgi:hypothetical protein
MHHPLIMYAVWLFLCPAANKALERCAASTAEHSQRQQQGNAEEGSSGICSLRAMLKVATLITWFLVLRPQGMMQQQPVLRPCLPFLFCCSSTSKLFLVHLLLL